MGAPFVSASVIAMKPKTRHWLSRIKIKKILLTRWYTFDIYELRPSGRKQWRGHRRQHLCRPDLSQRPWDQPHPSPSYSPLRQGWGDRRLHKNDSEKICWKRNLIKYLDEDEATKAKQRYSCCCLCLLPSIS